MLIILSFLMMFNFSGKNLKVENSYLRPAAKGMNSALYFDIKNNSDKADTLFAVESKAAKLVQIHESYKKNGMMGMRKVDFIIVPAHQTFKFKPGGHHVMFLKLTEDFTSGKKVDVDLMFKQNGKIPIKVPVKKQN